jgi:hypothetical protein
MGFPLNKRLARLDTGAEKERMRLDLSKKTGG